MCLLRSCECGNFFSFARPLIMPRNSYVAHIVLYNRYAPYHLSSSILLTKWAVFFSTLRFKLTAEKKICTKTWKWTCWWMPAAKDTITEAFQMWAKIEQKKSTTFRLFLLVFCWCVDWIWKFVCDSREKWCHLWGLIKMTETTAYFYWYFNHKSSIIFNRLKWWWIIKMTIVFCKKIIHFFPLILINITVAPNVWKCHKVVTDQISILQLIVATESLLQNVQFRAS